MAYVYMLIDGRNNKPFYIGKGKDERCNYHVKEAKYYPERKSKKLNKIRSILNDGFEIKIKKIEDDVTDEDALDFECLVISELRDIGFDLTNVTEGGDGASGYKHTEQHKNRMSFLMRGRKFDEATKEKMRKPKSPEGRAAIAEARKTVNYKPSEKTKLQVSQKLFGRVSPMKGRKQSEESKAKMSMQRKGVPKLKTICPHCEKSISVNTSKRWHFDNCKEKK